MKKITLMHSKLEGKIQIPPSKSFSHRYIIAASLAKGISILNNVVFSDDVNSTIFAMQKLGANISIKKNSLIIDGRKVFSQADEKEIIEIDCNESGSTLRFLIPLVLALKKKVRFYGKESLFKRPLTPYLKIFEEMGIEYKLNETSLFVQGNLKGGNFNIDGNISSQFITGLLFTAPLLKENSKIIINKNFESKMYVDITMKVLEDFRIKIEREVENIFAISHSQSYSNKDLSIEGDFSQAAFFLVANSLGANIEIEGLNQNSLQGDKIILELLEKIDNFASTGTLKIDGANCPDIIPILALKATLANKHVEIFNISRLRMKESDRINSTVTELKKLNFNIEEKEDRILIAPNNSCITHKNIIASSHNDHRIAMMLAIATLFYKGEITLENPDCVKKSYPSFWKDFATLGGKFI